MTKKEMEERITKLEAQVELLSRMVPQFGQCPPQPYMPQPQWQLQPPFQVTCSDLPQYDHSLPQPQYQPWPNTGPVKPGGT